MLRIFLLSLALFAADAQAQSRPLAVANVQNRLAAVTSYCGGVRASWTAFQPHIDTFPPRAGARPRRAGVPVSFEPSPGHPIDVLEMGPGQLRCSTADYQRDASEYVADIFALMDAFPNYVGGDYRKIWSWPVASSSPAGLRGWRWIMVTERSLGSMSLITVEYYNFTPESDDVAPF